MFMLTSAHMALALYECLAGDVPPRVLQAAVAIAQSELFLCDAVFIWRVWVVWNCDLRIVILPVVLLLAGFIMGLISAAEAVAYTRLSKIFPLPTVILAVANMAVCTVLIAGRLAYLDHLMNGHLAFRAGKNHAYRGLMFLLVESGAILTISNIIGLVLVELNHPGLHVMLDILVPLANIVPTSIVVLSHLRLVPGDTVNARLTETVTVRFATQLDDSACSRVHGASDFHGDCSANTTRTGNTLEFPPDVEKYAQCDGSVGHWHSDSR
ncbi:hypothetical protein BV20DRAFT_1052268 [Pilatotrama ljubarskyi]|nr:hypothetical protein BV20DRAFT_1052268 [Pilatotrama ljubarskyi]